MANQHHDPHLPVRQAPNRSQDPVISAPWQTRDKDEPLPAIYMPTHRSNHDSVQSFSVIDFADSTRNLASSLASAPFDHISSNQHHRSGASLDTLLGRPKSIDYHPGFPGPENFAKLRINEPKRGTRLSWKPFKNSIFVSSVPVLERPSSGRPPDGGITAWLQVLGGYLLFFNTWGLINAFGVFQTYYKEDLIPDKSNSAIAWIGTLTSFLLCASPITWGPVFDIGSPRLLVLFGSFSVVLGIMMTSLCETYWQLMLAQGICCGIGGGALFITATSVLPSYFSKNRALAMGISASGSSLGGIVYPIIFTYTQPTLGFGWSVRIIGFIALGTLAIPCLVIKPRARPPTRRRIVDVSILREVTFEIMNLATALGFAGQYIPYFFIEQFAGDHGLSLRFWMLIFLNAGSIPGRIIPSLIADGFFHPLKVLATTTSAATLLAFCWIAIQHSTAGLVVWCLLYGFCSGAFVSLQGAAVASMTTDLSTIGTRFGINMFAGALGILIGSPIGGAIFPQSWPGAQSFCGATLFLATLALVATYISLQRTKRVESRKSTA